MSDPAVPSPRRSFSDAMRNKYITEAIQSGSHQQYGIIQNIPYTTFRNKYNEYQQCSTTNQQLMIITTQML